MKDIITVIFLLVVLTAPFLVAHLLEKRRCNSGADQQGINKYNSNHTYYWGYLMGFSQILIPLVLIIAIPFSLLSGNETFDGDWDFLWGTLIIIAIGIPGYYCCKLNRWGFIASTVLTINPLIWIINYYYGRKRWIWKS